MEEELHFRHQLRCLYQVDYLEVLLKEIKVKEHLSLGELSQVKIHPLCFLSRHHQVYLEVQLKVLVDHSNKILRDQVRVYSQQVDLEVEATSHKHLQVDLVVEETNHHPHKVDLVVVAFQHNPYKVYLETQVIKNLKRHLPIFLAVNSNL